MQKIKYMQIKKDYVAFGAHQRGGLTCKLKNSDLKDQLIEFDSDNMCKGAVGKFDGAQTYSRLTLELGPKISIPMIASLTELCCMLNGKDVALTNKKSLAYFLKSNTDFKSNINVMNISSHITSDGDEIIDNDDNIVVYKLTNLFQAQILTIINGHVLLVYINGFFYYLFKDESYQPYKICDFDADSNSIIVQPCEIPIQNTNDDNHIMCPFIIIGIILGYSLENVKIFFDRQIEQYMKAFGITQKPDFDALIALWEKKLSDIKFREYINKLAPVDKIKIDMSHFT